MSNFDIIRIEGVGTRRKGVSSRGNAYDFVPVHITYDPRPGSKVEGRCAAEVLVDNDAVDRIRPVPGEEFTVTLNQSCNGLRIVHWISRGRVELDLL